MEIGLAHEETGISYFDLLKELKEKVDYDFNDEGEVTFFSWFSDNFFTAKFDIKLDNHGLGGHMRAFLWLKKKQLEEDIAAEYLANINKFENNLKAKYFLKGEAAKQYIDYLELVEARDSSARALSKANVSINLNIISIFIAIVALGITAFYSYKSYNKPELLYPTPPFEVNIQNWDAMKEKTVIQKDSIKIDSVSN